jgi:hypothetical protein
MNEFFVICVAFCILTLCCILVIVTTRDKDLEHRDEIRVGLLGTFVFLFVSWIVIYLANIHPFVKPEFKKSHKPSYYNESILINENLTI